MAGSRLNLYCALCGRTQAAGLLSGAAWGKVEGPPGVVLRACPPCKTKNPEWESQLRMQAQPAQ